MTNRTFIRKLLTTEYFFFRLADNLDLIFKDGWIYPDFDEPCCSVDSTCGWADALEKTCIEIGLPECWEYWASLGWEESDVLDGTIAELLCAIVFDKTGYRIGDGTTKLGARIKAAALLKDISLAEIAKVLDCTEEVTSRVLTGEMFISFQQLSDVAKLLDIPLSVLLKDVDSMGGKENA